MTRLQPTAATCVALLTVILAETSALAQCGGIACAYPYNSQGLQATSAFPYYPQNLRTTPVILEPEVARLLTKAIRNEVQFRGTEIYWQKRRINAEYRAEEKQRRMRTSQDVAQFHEHCNAVRELTEENRQFAQWAKKELRSRTIRLNASQYDSTVGVILWPVILEDQRFAEDRALVDAQFVVRTADSHVTPNVTEVTKATERMTENLARMVRQDEVDCQGYVIAKRFLTGVMNEARFADEPTVANLAAN